MTTKEELRKRWLEHYSGSFSENRNQELVYPVPEFLFDNWIWQEIEAIESKLRTQEALLQAADEVVQASRSIKLYATHGLIAEDYNKALEKYTLLKSQSHGDK